MPTDFNLKLRQLIHATDTLLWDAYRSAISGTHHAGQLVFPKTSQGKVRVSEQEAKQFLIGNLGISPFSFSVETPTIGSYSFSGVGMRNAMTDLSLYAEGVGFVNMEFKAGNTSTKRKNRGKIAKDIQKIVLEDVAGFWFHTLKATNRSSVATLWQTIRQELKAVIQETTVPLRSKLFTFHCCVLREAFSVQTTFRLDELSRANDWLAEVKPPSFRVQGGNLIEAQDADGWIVNRHVPKVEAATMEVN
ncbi:hypothetical protein BH11PLA2_BH11PLA2_16470 [soil metagenome]